MHQILIIFRKDCRRFWPEILLVLSTTIGFVWFYPYQWQFDDEGLLSPAHSIFDLRHLKILAISSAIMMCVSWLILISRVVHDENLVGNRHFWLTRPYRLKSLLAAKLLFVFIFVCVPFTSAQIALLYRAHFNPNNFVVLLGVNLTIIVIVVILPFFALAALTSSLLRIIGTLVTLSLLFAVAAFFTTYSPGPSTPSIPSSGGDGEGFILLFCGAAVILQYWKRMLWLSRGLFTAGLAAVLVLAASPFDRWLVAFYYYSPSIHESHIRLSIPSSSADGLRIWTPIPSQVQLHIPVRVMGIPQRTAMLIDNVRITIQSADKKQLTSSWQPANSVRRLTDTDTDDSVNVFLDNRLYSQIKSRPVRVSVELAFTTMLEVFNQTTSYQPGKEFELSDIGLCHFPDPVDQWIPELHCEMVFHDPPLTRVTISGKPAPCGDEADPQIDFSTQYGWIGSPSPVLSNDSFSPVFKEAIQTPNGSSQNRILCKDSKIQITRYKLQSRFRVAFQFQNVALPIEGAH